MRLIALIVALLAAASTASAAEVRILSGGAVQPGLEVLAQTFKARTGNTVTLVYATAAELSVKVMSGERFDLLVAPVDVVDKAVDAHKVTGPPVVVGGVGVSAVVRRGAPHPDVATVEALKLAVLAAKTVVYNRGSTGVYMEKAIARLGVADQIAARSVRPLSADEVMTRLQAGDGPELGFAATTVIQAAIDRGAKLDLVADLPAELQNITVYSAARFADAKPEAAAFCALLASPEGKAAMVAKGVK